MEIAYIHKAFKAQSLIDIARANEIIVEYQEQGFRLTLRQLYYQFVARGLIENTQRSYKRIGSLVNDGRLAGLVDWDAIEDRTRNLQAQPHWDSPQEIIRGAAKQFRLDKWADQGYRMEVWIEKDALTGVIEGTCNQFDVPYFSCRGYVSQSELWGAAQRFLGHQDNDQRGVVIHLGDHDPSGIDMTRDIADRFKVFGADVEVVRVALNMPQVDEIQPPPNPAKVTDSRFRAYMMEYGEESWELDALEPAFISSIIAKEIAKRTDTDKWMDTLMAENEAKEQMEKIADDM